MAMAVVAEPSLLLNPPSHYSRVDQATSTSQQQRGGGGGGRRSSKFSLRSGNRGAGGKVAGRGGNGNGKVKVAIARAPRGLGAASGEITGDGGIVAGTRKGAEYLLGGWRGARPRVFPPLSNWSSLTWGRVGEDTRVSAVQTVVDELSPAALFEAARDLEFESEEENEGQRDKGTGSSSNNKKKKDKGGASSVSSGIKLESISKTYKGAQVLKNVSWDVKKGERVGLVGINGAGKTTQLRIITGKEDPDAGHVVKARENMKIAFLSQEFEVVGSRTLREEFMSTFGDEMAILSRMEKVQVALENATDDMDLMAKLLDELDSLQQRAEASDLYNVDVNINKMMPELGFAPEDVDRLVASFSGGWQMRIALGKILLQEPDLLLLDEPTNHLDLDSIEWLEGYLKQQDVPMVIVSHDRAFLDQLCTKIVETDMGVSQTFPGNYSEYVLAKAAWVEAQRMAWEKQQKEIARAEEMIQRLSSGANSGRATSAEKQLEKMQEGQLVEKPFERKPLRFRFPELERSGRTVFEIKNLGVRYDDKVLFENANLLVERGEKVAIIGPNGCGKSTLLRMLMGLQNCTSGEISLGEHRVIPNYFEQNQAEALDLDKTVLKTIEEAAEDWKVNDIKALLGRCSFKAEMLHRKVAFLSGGEKARLALCKFMVTPSTLLVLDEPTNHLDIPSKEMLEEALREYSGTVVAVSHDRYFLRQIVNRVVEVSDGRLQDYVGDYNYYLEQNLEARQRELDREEELDARSPTVKAKSKMSKAEKELQKKQKAQSFQQGKAKGKVTKNAKRWN